MPSSTSTTNGQVPLSAIVHLSQRPGPLQITHFGQFPATDISFDVAPGSSLGAAVEAINQAQKDIDLPPSFVSIMQGSAAAFSSSLGNEVLRRCGTRRIAAGDNDIHSGAGESERGMKSDSGRGAGDEGDFPCGQPIRPPARNARAAPSSALRR